MQQESSDQETGHATQQEPISSEYAVFVWFGVRTTTIVDLDDQSAPPRMEPRVKALRARLARHHGVWQDVGVGACYLRIIREEMMAEGLLEYLTGHRDAVVAVGRVDTAQLRLWLRDMDSSSRAGVRKAWLVGRVLNAEREKLEHGEVERWEKARAKELERKVRTLRAYRYLAESMEDGNLAVALPIWLADKGLEGVLRAIRKVRKAQAGGTSMAAGNDVVAWKKRAKRLLKTVPVGRRRVEMLRDHLEDVQRLLAEAESAPETETDPVEVEGSEGTGGPGPTVKEAGDRYLAHLRDADVDRAELRASVRVVNGLVARLGGQRLVAEVTTQEIAELKEALMHGAAPPVAGGPAVLEKLLNWWRERSWVVW